LGDSFEHNLEWVLSGKEVNDLKSLSENSNSLLLLTVLTVSTNHKLVDESFGDWAVDLTESLLLVSTSGVWDVHLSLGSLDGKIIDKGKL